MRKSRSTDEQVIGFIKPKTPLRYLTAEEERRLLECLDPIREG